MSGPRQFVGAARSPLAAMLPALVAGALAVGGGAVAQDPPAGDGQEPARDREAERELGEALLRRHGRRSREVEVLLADYVQRRTTTLSRRPLVSSGTFLFVKKPACAVFRAAKPRTSIVRLTAERYEVFRPQNKRLERFLLDGPELSAGLFAAVGGDVDRLLRDFEVASARRVEDAGAPEPERAVRVRLVPKAKKVRRRLVELLVTLRLADAQLQAVAYRDPSGDLVEIQLAALRVNPEPAPSVEFDVPKDTKVIEHTSGAGSEQRR